MAIAILWQEQKSRFNPTKAHRVKLYRLLEIYQQRDSGKSGRGVGDN
jgi:hypothetical protein